MSVCVCVYTDASNVHAWRQLYSNLSAKTNSHVCSGAFVDFLQIVTGDVVMQASVKSAEAARIEYEQALQQGQTAALAESRGSSMFALKISIGAGDRTTVVLGYQQFLISRRGQYEYALALRSEKAMKADGSMSLPEVVVSVSITDTDGLKSVNIQKPEMSCAYQAASAVNMWCGMQKYSNAENKLDFDQAQIRFPSYNQAQVDLNPSVRDQQDAAFPREVQPPKSLASLLGEHQA